MPNTIAVRVPRQYNGSEANPFVVSDLLANTRFNNIAITDAVRRWVRERGTTRMYLLIDRIRHNSDPFFNGSHDRAPRVNFSNYQTNLTRCSDTYCSGRALDPMDSRVYQRYWTAAIWEAVASVQADQVNSLEARVAELEARLATQRDEVIEVLTNPDENARNEYANTLMEEIC